MTSTLTSTQHTDLRRVVDQIRGTASLIKSSADAVCTSGAARSRASDDGGERPHHASATHGGSSSAGAGLKPDTRPPSAASSTATTSLGVLDASDATYCVTTLDAAVTTLERLLDSVATIQDATMRHGAVAQAKAPVDVQRSDSGSKPPAVLLNDVTIDQASSSSGTASEASTPAVPALGVSSDSMQHRLSSSGDQVLRTSSNSKFQVPELCVMGATPRAESLVDDAETASAQQQKWVNPFREAKVIEEQGAEEADVARWLNDNFADQYKRESTGFEMRLQRSNSIMSTASAISSPRDNVDFSPGTSHLLPDGSKVIATKYSRSNTRAYTAFTQRRRYRALLAQVGVDEIPGINDSDFDIFPYLDKLGEDVFVAVCANVILQYNFINSLQINVAYFMNFLRELQKHYFSTNPYHNGCHAADVLQTTNVYLCTGDVKENFSDVELIAILFGAMVHDVGHPGISNAFLAKVRHPLAKLYNDVSILESMHGAMAFILLDKPECNFFETSKVWTRVHDADFRSLVVDVITGTDMKHHASMMQSVTDILEDGEIEDNEVARLFKAIVHAADLSNPMKPQHVYTQWMERVNAEFWQQGDEEKRLGVDVSMMCDRTAPAIFKSQQGFIEFVVKPFMMELAPVLPPVWMERLETNLAYVKASGAQAEADCIARISALSARRWVDMPIRTNSFFTVVMKYFDAYRLSSQLAMHEGSCESPTAGLGASPAASFRGMGLALKRTASVLETHQVKLAEDCETWISNIVSYRPAMELSVKRRHSLVRFDDEEDSPGNSRRGRPAELRTTLRPAADGGDVGGASLLGPDAVPADDGFYEGMCKAWLTSVFEFQMQHRLKDHQDLAKRTFVPYVDADLVQKIILDSPEGQELLRLREVEEQRLQDQLSGTLEAQDADRLNSSTNDPKSNAALVAAALAQGGGAPVRASVDTAAPADDGLFSWVRVADEEPPSPQNPNESHADFAAASLSNTASTPTPGAQHGSMRMTMLQAVKKEEYVADEDLIVDVMCKQPRLAVRLVEKIFHGFDNSHRNSVSHRSVKVIEPTAARAATSGAAGAMIRFVASLTKVLVTCFNDHVRRAKPLQGALNSPGQASSILVPGSPASRNANAGSPAGFDSPRVNISQASSGPNSNTRSGGDTSPNNTSATGLGALLQSPKHHNAQRRRSSISTLADDPGALSDTASVKIRERTSRWIDELYNDSRSLSPATDGIRTGTSATLSPASTRLRAPVLAIEQGSRRPSSFADSGHLTEVIRRASVAPPEPFAGSEKLPTVPVSELMGDSSSPNSQPINSGGSRRDSPSGPTPGTHSPPPMLNRDATTPPDSSLNNGPNSADAFGGSGTFDPFSNVAPLEERAYPDEASAMAEILATALYDGGAQGSEAARRKSELPAMARRASVSQRRRSSVAVALGLSATPQPLARMIDEEDFEEDGVLARAGAAVDGLEHVRGGYLLGRGRRASGTASALPAYAAGQSTALVPGNYAVTPQPVSVLGNVAVAYAANARRLDLRRMGTAWESRVVNSSQSQRRAATDAPAHTAPDTAASDKRSRPRTLGDVLDTAPADDAELPDTTPLRVGRPRPSYLRDRPSTRERPAGAAAGRRPAGGVQALPPLHD